MLCSLRLPGKVHRGERVRDWRKKRGGEKLRKRGKTQETPSGEGKIQHPLTSRSPGHGVILKNEELSKVTLAKRFKRRNEGRNQKSIFTRARILSLFPEPLRVGGGMGKKKRVEAR